MPSFEILMPNNKRIDLTKQVKSAKSEEDFMLMVKQTLKDAMQTQHVVGKEKSNG
tara:strand:- start:213 stop:377 length:165 start_codon:yes stop_codon:yes gene_type:complete